jgi:hypothetical protein
VTNIRDLKRYQWQAAYYAVALMGALVAIAHWSESSLGLRLLLVIGCGITAWLRQVIDASLREGLERQREGVEKIYSAFSSVAREIAPTTPADRDAMPRTLFSIVVAFAVSASLAILFFA